MFTEKDLEQIKHKGITPEKLTDQLKRFKEGFPALEIARPAIVGNGITKLSSDELASYAAKYDNSELDVLKFVPASGAATRMFKSLFTFLDSVESGADRNLLDDDIQKFFSSIQDFAYYDELNQKLIENRKITIREATESKQHHLIVEELLKSSGLNYGNLPKGLLSFHKYDDGARTAAQEHLAECLDYVEKNGQAKVHFTISPTHQEAFEKHIFESIEKLNTNKNIEATFSEQFANTDTLAANSDYEPFRDESGKLLFRPAGHGALLSNLNSLDADVIFIKNIDNVVPDRLRKEGVQYKKALAGVLLTYQERIFELIKSFKSFNSGNSVDKEGIDLLKELGIEGDFSENQIVELLDRPLRICGMVKNEGEPGGGPFWVNEKTHKSLQIVESAQVNKSDKNQSSIFESGTHFNPVDIVCSTKNHRGEKYDLINFRDEETGFIAEKSYNGKQLLAMELPGLWNGSMANWNTIFVEVPLSTFNPVKTINDLLKPGHQ